MSLFPEIFRSVELIWVLWGFSIPACVGLGFVLRRLRVENGLSEESGKEKVSSRKFLRDEDGAAYAVPYVMTFPLYAMFVALVIECSLLLVTKVGSMYAAYAAARSAVVWESAKSRSGAISAQKMNEKAQRAAVLAMIPFASGSSQHSSGSTAGADLVPSVLTAAELYRSGRFVNPNYLMRKVQYSASHTNVTGITRDSGGADALLKAQLEFDAPFHIPGIGRILGQDSGNGYYVIKVTSAATLPTESPQNETRDIGIEYLSE